MKALYLNFFNPILFPNLAVVCNACYIGETKRHLKTRIKEYSGKDKNLHIFKHLQENTQCIDCLDVIDTSHVTILNKQIKHITQFLFWLFYPFLFLIILLFSLDFPLQLLFFIS